MKNQNNVLVALSLVGSLGAGCVAGESGTAEETFALSDRAPVQTSAFADQVAASMPLESIDAASRTTIRDMGWQFYVCPEFIYNLATTYQAQGLVYGAPGIAPPPGIWGSTQSGHNVTIASVNLVGGNNGAPPPHSQLICGSGVPTIEVGALVEDNTTCFAVNNGLFHGFICQ